MNILNGIASLLLISSIGTPLFKVGDDLGTGISIKKTVNSLSESFDSDTLNVYYDLMLLYGDKDSDGKLTKDEANEFHIDSLLPNKDDPTQDPSFKFLGLYPTLDSIYFFCFFNEDYSDTDSFNWYLSFQDKIVQNNLLVTDSKAKLINKYKIDSGGVFYKLKVENYSPSFNEKDHAAINIKSVYIRKTNEEMNYVEKNGFNATFDFDRSYLTNNRFYNYFSDESYSVSGVLDLMVGYTKSELYTFLWIPSPHTRPVEAQDMYFFFFNFDDYNFDPASITKIGYSYDYLTYEQDQYYVSELRQNAQLKDNNFSRGSPIPSPNVNFNYYSWNEILNTKLGVYPGKYLEGYEPYKKTYGYDTNVVGSPGPKEVSFNYDSRLKSSVSKTSVTSAGITVDWNQTFLSKDSMFGFKSHADVVKNQKVDSLIKLSETDTKYSGDQFKSFRDFLHEGDHQSFKWAFLLNGDDGSYSSEYWGRKIISDGVADDTKSLNQFLGNNSSLGGSTDGSYSMTTYKTTTLAHEARNLITLWMSGIKNNGEKFTVWTHNDPANVRYVYAYSQTPPTFGELLINDISVALQSFLEWLAKNPWFWWLIGGFIVLLFVLLLFFCPSLLKGIYYVLKFLAWIPYIILVWPIGKLAKKDLPVWPFK